MDREISNSEIFKWFVLSFLAFVLVAVWFIPHDLIVALSIAMIIEGSVLWLLPVIRPELIHDEWP
ncbi:MAG: hypothetical protein SA339_07045 [Methanomassiliicoccus sp.]|nr:hypothetical protein [Methanomassiliicoccus sp.]